MGPFSLVDSLLYWTFSHFAMGFLFKIDIIFRVGMIFQRGAVSPSLPAHIGSLWYRLVLPHTSIKTPSPQLSYFAAGGLLLVWFFQWAVTYFLLIASGIRLKYALCLCKPMNLTDPSLRETLAEDPKFDAYSSLFGTFESCFTLRSQSLKVGCFSPAVSTGLVLLSTWDSPFLSVCIVLYPLAFVNNF